MISVFAAYLRERFRFAVFGPAIASLVAAALWVNGNTPQLTTIVRCTGLAALLLLQFRLWDDLEDRESDQAAHPSRVLVCTSAAPFEFALAVLGCTNVALIAAIAPPLAIACLMVLYFAFWLAYRWLRPRIPNFVWRFQILLLKYPAFVVLLAAATGSAQSTRLITAMVATYASACAYEVLHNKRDALGVVS
jgi:hypothetical protein